MADSAGRYGAGRWAIAFGTREGAQKHALNMVNAALQSRVPYTLRVVPSSQIRPEDEEHLLLLGGPDDNPLIAALADKDLVTRPDPPESYTALCAASPWNASHRIVAITGSDDAGVLHGAAELCEHLLPRYANPDMPTRQKLREALDGLPDFSVCSHPRVHRRGLWTWGYVIRDYRSFIDNMARLRMNALTLWNDVPPLNLDDITDYAHERAIQVVAGYPWGWGTNSDLSSADGREQIRRAAVEHYRAHYEHSNVDGIYFQTLTEHNRTETSGRTTALLAAELVNAVSSDLYALSPQLRIEFGLHATSIMDNYTDLAGLDPRVVIVWEDAGVIPYSYDPVPSLTKGTAHAPPRLKTFEETLAYSRKIATFRPGSEFAIVPKGWTTLDWHAEFEHHGPYLLGEQGRASARRRLAERRPKWDELNRKWLANYRYAVRFYREILNMGVPAVSATALVEDGAFEAHIQPSVALFAETVWDPTRHEDELLVRALAPSYAHSD
jgi:hypothetical protein